ncbi:uncharacterized protein EV422DRAFT_197056 [Fimicolochytrium jonesii]|uniref:uncharacterized protein n=1 Tax=Fimicolochytrium jonesii TaxID=1396493 RepID=UPI0022FE033D|nr:uncharacterized protein EV422DRAFT_197056 [Fimicolochytrium jonesii]KAI8817904.1 hypothetical protein EV422DRAFT_197056 [Fimicolochytrium jonesii]
MAGTITANPASPAAASEATASDAVTVKRLYVSGLREDIDKKDLGGRFATFGKVVSVDLAGGGPLGGCRGFGYVTIEGKPSSIAKCQSIYNGSKWKGMQLHVEEAKQDYMTKLKREWAEIQAQEDSRKDGRTPTISNKKRKKRAVDHAADMTLVTDRNCKNKKNWRLSRFGRGVSVFRYRNRATGKLVTIDPLRHKNNITRPESYAQFTPVVRLTWPSDNIVAPAKANRPTSSVLVDGTMAPIEVTEEVTGGLFDDTDDEEGPNPRRESDYTSESGDDSDETPDLFDEPELMDIEQKTPLVDEEDVGTSPMVVDSDPTLDDDDFEIVPQGGNTSESRVSLPHRFSDDDDDDFAPPTSAPQPAPIRKKRTLDEMEAEQKLSNERLRLLQLAELTVVEPKVTAQTNSSKVASFEDEGDSSDSDSDSDSDSGETKTPGVAGNVASVNGTQANVPSTEENAEPARNVISFEDDDEPVGGAYVLTSDDDSDDDDGSEPSSGVAEPDRVNAGGPTIAETEVDGVRLEVTLRRSSLTINSGSESSHVEEVKTVSTTPLQNWNGEFAEPNEEEPDSDSGSDSKSEAESATDSDSSVSDEESSIYSQKDDNPTSATPLEVAGGASIELPTTSGEAASEFSSESDESSFAATHSGEESKGERNIDSLMKEDAEREQKTENASAAATSSRKGADSQGAQTAVAVPAMSGDRHYAVNTNLRALVFGGDEAESSGFSLFGGPEDDAATKADQASSFSLFPFANDESSEAPMADTFTSFAQPSAITSSMRAYTTPAVHDSFSSSIPLFFLHLDKPELAHRSNYAPNGTFMRTQTEAEITMQWEDSRRDLTYEFKSKHKSAARKREKLKRSRGGARG